MGFDGKFHFIYEAGSVGYGTFWIPRGTCAWD